MPGTNAGTGQPLTARCAKCITKATFGRRRHYGDPQLTGRQRYRPNRKGGPRIDTFYQYEYRCGDCGHVGWSRHIDLARRWMRLRGEPGCEQCANCRAGLHAHCCSIVCRCATCEHNGGRQSRRPSKDVDMAKKGKEGSAQEERTEPAAERKRESKDKKLENREEKVSPNQAGGVKKFKKK